MENNELEMSLFNDDFDLELNLGDTPINEGPPIDDIPPTDTPPVDEPPVDTPPVDENTNPVEDNNPENVDGGEEAGEGSDADITSPNLYSSFASELHKQGVLPTLDLDNTKIDNTTALGDVIQSEINRQTKDYIINKVGEEGYKALEEGVTLASFQEHQNAVLSLDKITEDSLTEDLDLAKQVILQDYMNQGLSEKRATKILNKTIDLGEDAIVEDALESISSLKVFEEKRIEQQKVDYANQQKENKAHQEKIDNDLKHAIYGKSEFIKGVELTKGVQDKVYKAITNIVGESPNGVMENQLMRDRREAPIEFDAKLYYLYELTDGFSDFSKLKAKATSKAVSDFDRVLRQHQNQFKDGGAPAFVVDKDSYDGLGSELVL